MPSHAEFADRLQRDQSRIYGFLYSLVRDTNDADDLFQQTTLILWNKFAEFDRSRSFFAWACGIARGEVANFLRSRSRSKLYFTDEFNLLMMEAHESISVDEMEERREALHGCLKRLRDRDRELLAACYSEDAGVSNVAEKAGRSPQSVHNSLRRIRRALFECIQRRLQEHGGKR